MSKRYANYKVFIVIPICRTIIPETELLRRVLSNVEQGIWEDAGSFIALDTAAEKAVCFRKDETALFISLESSLLPAGIAATAAATAAAVTAATAAPAATPAAAKTTTTVPLRFGASFIYRKIAPFDRIRIKFRNCFLSGFIRSHFHESESTRSPGIQIPHDGHRFDFSFFFKQLPQLIFSNGK
jgi:hypothetical protein